SISLPPFMETNTLPMLPLQVSQETVVLPAPLLPGTGFGLALRKGGRFSSRQNARSSLSASAGVEFAVSPIVTYDKRFHPVRSINLFSPWSEKIQKFVSSLLHSCGARRYATGYCDNSWPSAVSLAMRVLTKQYFVIRARLSRTK